MKIIARCKSLRWMFSFVFFTFLLLNVDRPVHAYIYTGGDWGGRDLSLLAGDSLSGTFDNVGSFYIPSGVTILGDSGNLLVNANSILIDGSLIGANAPRFNLGLFSQTYLNMNGSLESWKAITLSAQSQMTLNGTFSALGDGGTGLGSQGIIRLNPPGGTIIFTPPGGGPFVITPSIPIPAAAWLFGSGLLGLVGIRRRQK